MNDYIKGVNIDENLEYKSILFDKLFKYIKIEKHCDVDCIVIGYDGIGFIIDRVFEEKVDLVYDLLRNK